MKTELSGQARVEAPHRLAQGGGEPRRIRARPHHERHPAPGVAPIGHVDLAPRLRADEQHVAALARLLHDADHGEPGTAGDAEPPADRIRPAAELEREVVAHHHDVTALGLLLRAEQPALPQPHAGRLEVSGADRVVGGARRALGLDRTPLHLERASPPAAGLRVDEGQAVRDTRLVDLRPRPQPAGELLDERGPAPSVRVGVAREGEARREDAPGVESGVDPLAPDEALDHEGGADEEDQGEAQLGDDEQAPQPGPWATRHAAGSLLEAVHDVQVPGLQHGHEADHERARTRDRDDEGEGPHVEIDPHPEGRRAPGLPSAGRPPRRRPGVPGRRRRP